MCDSSDSDVDDEEKPKGLNAKNEVSRTNYFKGTRIFFGGRGWGVKGFCSVFESLSSLTQGTDKCQVFGSHLDREEMLLLVQ